MGMKLADQLFGAAFAEAALEALLEPLFPEDHIFELSWDYYDASLEIHWVPKDWRLPPEMLQRLFDEGFSIIYLNHEDNMETYYSKGHQEGFRISRKIKND